MLYSLWFLYGVILQYGMANSMEGCSDVNIISIPRQCCNLSHYYGKMSVPDRGNGCIFILIHCKPISKIILPNCIFFVGYAHLIVSQFQEPNTSRTQDW